MIYESSPPFAVGLACRASRHQPNPEPDLPVEPVVGMDDVYSSMVGDHAVREDGETSVNGIPAVYYTLHQS